jgi:hypothetical protein
LAWGRFCIIANDRTGKPRFERLLRLTQLAYEQQLPAAKLNCCAYYLAMYLGGGKLIEQVLEGIRGASRRTEALPISPAQPLKQQKRPGEVGCPGPSVCLRLDLAGSYNIRGTDYHKRVHVLVGLIHLPIGDER